MTCSVRSPNLDSQYQLTDVLTCLHDAVRFGRILKCKRRVNLRFELPI